MPFSDLDPGQIAYFYPAAELPLAESVEPDRGFVRIDGPWCVVDVLDEHGPFSSRPREVPRDIVALTPTDSLILHEVVANGGRTTSGYRASSLSYRSRTILGATLHGVRSMDPMELVAKFHGISRWAGLSALEERQTIESSRWREVTVTVRSEDVTKVESLTRRRELTLSPDWSVSGPEDRREVSAPVAFGCRSDRPQEVWSLLQPLIAVQSLISLAYGGFVAASSGAAGLSYMESERSPSTPWLWSGALMTAAPGARKPDQNAFPLFDLATLGGLAGLRRWIDWTVNRPRVINPLIWRYRMGPASAPVSLMEIAAGIEYFVKISRPAAWAATSGKARWPEQLARRVGESFLTWIGDVDRWAPMFWETYNQFKHGTETTLDHDDPAVWLLAESGRFLLAGAVADRIALTKAPSRMMFAGPMLNNLGTQVRQLLK